MVMVMVVVAVIVVVVGAVAQKNVLQDGATWAGKVGRPAGHRQTVLHLRLVEGLDVLLGDDLIFGRQYGALLEDDGRHRLVEFRADRPVGEFLLLVLRRALHTLRRLEIAVGFGDLDFHLSVFVFHCGVVLLEDLVAAYRGLGVLAEIQHIIVLRVGLAALFGRRQNFVVVAV